MSRGDMEREEGEKYGDDDGRGGMREATRGGGGGGGGHGWGLGGSMATGRGGSVIRVCRRNVELPRSLIIGAIIGGAEL